MSSGIHCEQEQDDGQSSHYVNTAEAAPKQFYFERLGYYEQDFFKTIICIISALKYSAH